MADEPTLSPSTGRRRPSANRDIRPGDDTVTQLARSAQVVSDQFQDAIGDVTGEQEISVEEFTEVYLNATFEERMKLFLETFGTSGADGLEFLAEVQDRATRQFRSEGLI